MTREDAEKIEQLVVAGERLSNMAWNIGHNYRPGESLSEHTIETCKALAESWDEQWRQSREARFALRDLPAAYDPIEMGA